MSVSGGFGEGGLGGFGAGGSGFDSSAFGGFEPADTLESDRMPEGRTHLRREVRRQLRRALRREALAEVVPTLPQPGTSVHIVANGNYDFWTWCPHLLELLETPARVWASTWTMNRGNALELLALIDAGSIETLVLLTGLYFKRRESAVYATLVEGLQERGQRYLALRNHAKVLVLRTAEAGIVVEGSANFTANPRVEQYVLTACPELADFHAGWMQDAVDG